MYAYRIFSNTFPLFRVIIYKISRLRKRQFNEYKTDEPFFSTSFYLFLLLQLFSKLLQCRRAEIVRYSGPLLTIIVVVKNS
jgi:hypothetical protein